MNRDALRACVERFGLGKLLPSLIAAAKPTVLLAANGPVDRTGSAKSHIGGTPLLPATVEWPRWKGASMSFVAQIHLPSLPAISGRELLPDEGNLVFFYDQRRSTWGFDPKDRGSWAVMHCDDSTRTRRDWPADLSSAARYREVALVPETSLSLPAPASPAARALRLDDEQLDAYRDLVRALSTRRPRHRLLGHPDALQGDMQLECELVTNGLYCGDVSGYQDPRRRLLEPQAEEWMLLLQLDSDRDAGMRWGDDGRLYFWIRTQDAAARKFSEVWMVLQSG